MKYASLSLTVILGMVLLFLSSPAEAQVTCANVRCASGSCVDTSSGPVCGQVQSCASTLCQRGSACVESAQGPQCVASSQPTYTPWPQNVYRSASPSYYRPYHYRPYWHRPNHYRPHYGRTYSGPHYSYYQRPSYYQLYGHERPYRPGPVINPNPGTSGDGMVCPMNYDPVCGQKIVQCIQAPCPPLQKTFGNSCEARAQGYDVLSKGTCG